MQQQVFASSFKVLLRNFARPHHPIVMRRDELLARGRAASHPRFNAIVTVVILCHNTSVGGLRRGCTGCLRWVVPRELGLPEERRNVEGGAVAHDHPIGGTGAVLTTKLIHSMRRDGLPPPLERILNVSRTPCRKSVR